MKVQLNIETVGEMIYVYYLILLVLLFWKLSQNLRWDQQNCIHNQEIIFFFPFNICFSNLYSVCVSFCLYENIEIGVLCRKFNYSVAILDMLLKFIIMIPP